MTREFIPLEFLQEKCQEENEISTRTTEKILGKVYGEGYQHGAEDFSMAVSEAMKWHKEKFGVEYVIHDTESFWGLIHMYKEQSSEK